MTKKITVGSLLSSLILVAGLGILLRGDCFNAAAQKECHLTTVGATQAEVKAGVSPELWAVVVGVGIYEFGDRQLGPWVIHNLQYATDDADAIYDFLRSERGGAFRADHIRLLKDEEATKANVLEALQWLRQAKPDDYFVIFIAAHGAVNSDQLPYFVLYDTDPRDFAHTGLEMPVLRQVVEREFLAKGLVLTDTCHSAGVTLLGQPQSAAVNESLDKQMQNINRAVGYLSAAYQTEPSYESDELYHGVFTYCLLEALRGDADADYNKIVTFDEVVKYLFEEVPKQTGGHQHITAATNNIDTNCMPLATARYVGQDSRYGTAVIRNPDLDGVQFRIDRGPYENLERGIETTFKISAGPHEVAFVQQGTLNAIVNLVIRPGEMREIKLEFTFAQNAAAEATETPNEPVIAYMIEDKAPLPQAVKLFQEGVDDFAKQQFKQAVEKLDRAISANHGVYQQALVYRGRAQQSLGQTEKAVASFAEAYRLKLSDYHAETTLAEAEFDLAKVKPDARREVQAIANRLKQIIRRDPKYDFARVVLGDILFYLGNNSGAERELRHALAANPDSPPTHMILADVLSLHPLRAKREEAIKEADQALELYDRLSTKKITFKRLSISHLIFGGGRYVDQAAMAEAHYILAKAINNVATAYPGSPAADLNRARASINKAMQIAESIHDSYRQALVLCISAQTYMLVRDTASAIRDGERGLKVAQALNQPKLTGALHAVLSPAYESSQNYCKSAEHQQGYIQQYGPKPNELGQAEARLKYLRDQAEAHRQKCK